MFSSRFTILILCLFIPLLLITCSNRGSTEPQLDYKLSQHVYQPELVQPLEINTNANTVEFSVQFKGGGGSYDQVRLDVDDGIIHLILFDTDGVMQKMFVIYKLTGSISELSHGDYTLQIENIDRNVITKETFQIQ